MTESYSATFRTKSHRRHSGKLTTVCMELTNPDPSLGIGFEDLATIGQRWSLTPSPMLSDVCLSDPWWLHPSSTGTSSSNIFFMAIWDVRNGCYRTHQLSNFQRTSLHLGHNNYFSMLAEVVPLKEVKISNMIKFIKHHILYRFGVPNELSMTMDPNLSVKHFRGFVTSSRSKVCLQQHTIQLLTVL